MIVRESLHTFIKSFGFVQTPLHYDRLKCFPQVSFSGFRWSYPELIYQSERLIPGNCIHKHKLTMRVTTYVYRVLRHVCTNTTALQKITMLSGSLSRLPAELPWTPKASDSSPENLNSSAMICRSTIVLLAQVATYIEQQPTTPRRLTDNEKFLYQAPFPGFREVTLNSWNNSSPEINHKWTERRVIEYWQYLCMFV